MTRAAVLSGLGAWAPPHEVSNDEIAALIGRDDEWIRARTGIASRRRVAPGVSTGTLAVGAGRRALRSAEVSTVDHVILATTTPERIMPATAPAVASALGLSAPAFDLNAACSGFVYGLAVASSLIIAGTAESVLLIGADTLSSITDPTDPMTAPLLADGAGAVVLRAGHAEELGALHAFDLHSEGEHVESLKAEHGGRVVMQGRQVFMAAVRNMAASAVAAVETAGFALPDLDRVIGHQANIRILHAVADQLGLTPDRLVTNLVRFGNTSAASIPLAMVDGVSTSQLNPGELALVTAFGAGFTWGATTLRWPALVVEKVD
ncbi:beta-ketoacyl-ACP synthase III [Amycolatopsis sp. EV170708-02-1]|uniref:beta-ketoacyl-ACP synthase III n=1 Tax=Amycolatopsis sp. EV170708-02-1 TaxID=2919322 RepID=UPI001F0C92D3|nr:beta-ketoacyl-ACP synthase III [Amycolatopsis sp. EV170708-02-1]UMP06741.1 ketoacyl-ACP synthase III [Amycolatopsis sp. EV170708-02-1]